MLARYPRFARRVEKTLGERFESVHREHLGPLGGVKKIIHHEGRRGRFVDPENRRDVVIAPTEQAVSRTISVKEIMEGDLVSLIARLDGAAQEMADSSMKLFLRRMNEAVTMSRNTIDLAGRTLDAESFLRMFEMTRTDFTPGGDPIFPTLLLHPDMVPNIKALHDQLERNPEYKRRWDEIMNKKREHWDAREANRRLVG